MFGSCSLTTYLSATHDRQGPLVAAPLDLRTKKAESFLATAVAELSVHTQEKESQDRCDVTNCYYEKLQAERSGTATVPFVFRRGRASNPWRKTLSYFWTRVRKYLVVEKGTIPPEKVPLPMDPPAWQETQVNFSQSRQSFASTGVSTSLA